MLFGLFEGINAESGYDCRNIEWAKFNDVDLVYRSVYAFSKPSPGILLRCSFDSHASGSIQFIECAKKKKHTLQHTYELP